MSLFGDSLKKSKIMKDTSLIISMTKKGDRDLAYKKFYDFISTFSTLSPMIQGNLSFEEYKQISIKLSMYGLAWEKGYFVPIAIFAFLQPLAFVIGNKDVFLNCSLISEEFNQTAYLAQAILLK